MLVCLWPNTTLEQEAELFFDVHGATELMEPLELNAITMGIGLVLYQRV